MTLNRRQFIYASLTTLASCSMPQFQLRENAGKPYHYTLTAVEAPITIVPNTHSPGMAFNGQYPAPVIRAKQGVPIHIHFVNQLSEATTIHWHGIRIDNRMDGVPQLTQPPVMPGESFDYIFTCPDAGTFWYHPHMNSLQQLGRGLTGLLVVEEAEPTAFTSDVTLELRDWHIAEDGHFLAMSSPRQAARMGTLGNVKTVNAQLKPVIDIPAGQLTRLRIANIDNTRVYTINLKEFAADVLAIDGIALDQSFPLDTQAIGAGMRVDLGFVSPPQPGEDIVIYDQKGRLNFEICRLRTVATDMQISNASTIPSLPRNTVARPQLYGAEEINFVFEWAGALSPADEHGKVESEFWTINKRAWKGHGSNVHDLPEPLATLELGKTYIFNLHNATPHHHPIHLHGYSFTVLASDKKSVTPYQTDTILLEKYERARVALVADNPGRWMYHCHVIEHMMTGLMGYIVVA